MGFLTFNEKYFVDRLHYFENRDLSECEVYEVRQLLKVLDDLADEGYTVLNDYLEEKHQCLSRLKSILANHGEKPFEISFHRLPDVCYGKEEHELCGVVERLIDNAGEHRTVSDHYFVRELKNYCEWIGYEEGAAYVFLLRDALLPYVYYRCRNRGNLHPWLIGRTFLEQITGIKNADDMIRLPIYEALEEGITDYTEYKEYCRKKMKAVLDHYPDLKRILLELLGTIASPEIIVVESGYCGTIPMLLTSLDERVDFRMYTTAPFLYELYKGRIFNRKYEEIRSFETLYSQDLLMKFSSYRDGKFMVKLTDNRTAIRQSYAETAAFLK